MKPRKIALLASLLAVAILGLPGPTIPLAQAAPPPAPAISDAASTALARMAASLRSTAFSFRVRTIRVAERGEGETLHIGHQFKVTVRRPDRLLVDGTGDDGPRRLLYDGKTAFLVLDDGKEYASLQVPDTIEGMMHVIVGRFGIDLPLADFLTDAPDKAFLFGVTAGRDAGPALIDGVPCRHLVFSQPPGMTLELWLEANERTLPRRLIVTYRSLPGSPTFVAEMSDWNLGIQPPDSAFRFEPPPGAEQIQLRAALKDTTGGRP